jgi:hypothetical protein
MEGQNLVVCGGHDTVCMGKEMGIQQLRLLLPGRFPRGGVGHKVWKWCTDGVL